MSKAEDFQPKWVYPAQQDRMTSRPLQAPFVMTLIYGLCVTSCCCKAGVMSLSGEVYIVWTNGGTV